MVNKVAILSLLVAVMISRGSYADGTDKYEGRLEETVVTATGFDDAQNNQIKNIIVITSEDIKEKGYNNVQEILENAPGVVVLSGGILDIRGQGGSENSEKNVKVLIDGVELNITEQTRTSLPLNTMSVESIERVEIINGGGTVLYGSGTAGGVVNIITKKAKSDKDVYGRAYYQNSSFGTNKFGLSTGIKIFDNFIVDLQGENLNGRGYRKNEKESSTYLQGGLTWNLADNQKIRFRSSMYDGESYSTSSLTLAEVLEDRRQAGDTLTKYTTKRESYTLNYDGKFFEKLDIGLVGFRQKYNSEITYPTTTRGVTTVSSRIPVDIKEGVGLKGNYNYGSGNIIFGYDFSDSDSGRKVINITTNTINQDVSTKKTVNSIYLMNRQTLTSNLDGTIGYRYEHSKYNNTQKNSTGNIISDEKFKQSNHAVEAGLNFRYSGTGNIYGKFEKGFRSPNPTELINLVPNAANTAVLRYELSGVKSEKYNTYEIGVKDMLWNSFVSGSIFYTTKKDEINLEANGRFDRKYLNIQETERKGFELFAEQYFGKLRINESFSYIDGKITKGNNKGSKIPSVIPKKLTLGVAYEILTGLNLKGNLNYYSGANPTSTGYKKSSLAITNVAASYKNENGFSVEGGIKNIFGKKYYDSEDIEAYDPAPERTYFIGVSYEF